MKTKITMSLIAQKAGVSQPTVSIVLNNAQTVSISEETKNKVLQVAKELGYKKKINTIRNNSYNIAFVIDGALYNYDHFIVSLNAATQRATELKCNLSFINTLLSKDSIDNINKSINNNEIDALIIATNMTTERSNITNLNIPTIYLNCIPKDISSYISILPDDYQNSFNIAKILCKNHNKPALLAGDIWMKATLDRIAGIKDAYDEENISIEQNDIYYTSWSFQEAFLQTQKIINSNKKYNIIYCASDYIAVAAYLAISSNNMKIPEDISIVGYDNQPISNELFPKLTTVELPYEKMATIALDYAYALAKGKKIEGIKIKKLTGEIFIRDSVK